MSDPKLMSMSELKDYHAIREREYRKEKNTLRKVDKYHEVKKLWDEIERSEAEGEKCD